MRDIWADQRKFQIWLEIELLACEAMAELGQIPKKDAAEIRKGPKDAAKPTMAAGALGREMTLSHSETRLYDR